jgi:hypothetical protein
MIPNLSRYLDRVYATIHSRDEVVVEELSFSTSLPQPVAPVK